MSFKPSIVSNDTDTTRELPLLDLRLRPGAVLPSGRLTAGLFASIDVVAGTAAVAIEGFDFDLHTGEAIDIAATSDPAVWNTGDETAHLVVALRLPQELLEEDLLALLAAVEAYANLGSRRDVTGRTGDGLVRFALGRELDDLAALVRNEVTPEQILAYAA